MKVSLLELETVLITKRTVVRRFREHEGKVFFRLLGENSPVLDVQPLIGYIAFSSIDWSLPKAAVTGFIDKNRQGNGYMSEVLLSLFPFAFRYAGLEKLTLLVSTENTAAQRLARKCGFQREGDLREEMRRKSGEPLDLLLFGLTKSAYEKV